LERQGEKVRNVGMSMIGKESGRKSMAAAFALSALVSAGGICAGGWEIQSSGVSTGIGHVVFKTQQCGWAAGDSCILHTSNGGATWIVQFAQPLNFFHSIDFADTLNGLAVGFAEAVPGPDCEGIRVVTGDGGATWTYMQGSYLTESWFIACRLLGPGLGWCSYFFSSEPYEHYGEIDPLQGSEQVLHTDYRFFQDICALDTETVWAVAGGPCEGYVGYNEVYRTSGDSWILISDSFPDQCLLSGISFIDANRGWLVAGKGYIWHSTDGGFHWVTQYSDTTQAFGGLSVVDSANVWVVGDSGLILRTRDGGQHWQPETSRVTVNLHSVSFMDTSDGWAVGDGGTILHYAANLSISEPPVSRSRPRDLRLRSEPNPATGPIRLTLEHSEPAFVGIMDAAGSKVWEAALAADANSVTWPCVNSQGRRCPAGIYFCRAAAGTSVTGAKLLLLK
jgi:hypothetical protein